MNSLFTASSIYYHYTQCLMNIVNFFFCYHFCYIYFWARGSIVVKALCYKPEGRGFDTRWGEFLNLPNLSGRTRPWGYTQPLTEISTRNIKIVMFLGTKCGWCVGLTTLPPSMSRLSRQCGIFNISQPYRPPQPVTGITFTFILSRFRKSLFAENYSLIWERTLFDSMQKSPKFLLEIITLVSSANIKEGHFYISWKQKL
jgi:hypothetical protein